MANDSDIKIFQRTIGDLILTVEKARTMKGHEFFIKEMAQIEDRLYFLKEGAPISLTKKECILELVHLQTKLGRLVHEFRQPRSYKGLSIVPVTE